MSANDCNLAWVAQVTGISYKTLSTWANHRDKLPSLDRPKVIRTKLFDWQVIRPLLVALVRAPTINQFDIEHLPIRRWPR